MKKRAIVVFAAGKGTRMKSALPKVLQTIAGKCMLDFVLESGDSLNPEQIILIASPDLLSLLEEKPDLLNFPKNKLTLVLQDPPEGSGHAMMCAMDALSPEIEEVIVLFGDVPLIQMKTVEEMLVHTDPLTLLAMTAERPHPYGRMILKDGYVQKILEAKEDTDRGDITLPTTDLVWTGVLRASVQALRTALPKLKKAPITDEYQLTGIVDILSKQNPKSVSVEVVTDDARPQFDGVNDKTALACMEMRFQGKMRQKFLEGGVKMIAPETVFFHHDTVIEADVTLHPFVTFGKSVVIEAGATILPHCHIQESTIGKNASIGPFAHLRGGNKIGESASIGNFVEVKKSTFERGAKVKHLSYIGDATLGEKVNVGAGTVTCNYDGVRKSQTIIERGVFVGANSTLVAPLTLGEDAKIAAGSVITKDVSKNTLAFGRARQENKINQTKES